MENAEMMKHELLTKLSTFMPHLKPEDLSSISSAFDIVSQSYSISKAETHLAVLGREQMLKLIKTYIVVKKMEGLSENTIDRYLLYLNQFMLFARKPIDELTGNDIRMFLFEYQESHSVTNRTLDGIRSIVCTFLRWAAAEHYIPNNPSETIKAIRYEEKPRKALEQIELERLRRACKTPRDLAIVETIYSTGCRVSELINIKLNDINWETHSVELFGKGKKHRTSFLNAKAEIAIREYLNTRKKESIYLINGERGQEKLKKEAIERIVRLITKRSMIQSKKITPHVLRHTTATQALKNGMPITDIQKLLGHENISTTMIYAHTSVEGVQSSHMRCVV